MFKVLDQSGGDVLGVEVSDAYTVDDVDAFKKEFEQLIAKGHARVNVLVKMDRLDLSKITLRAFVEDSFYSLKNIHRLRHIAVVGDSKLAKALVELDNRLLGKKKDELIEKYFDISELEDAWKFVQS